MPTIFIEAPAGVRNDAKKKLVEKTTAAVDEAYHIPDVRVFLRVLGGADADRRPRCRDPRFPLRAVHRA